MESSRPECPATLKGCVIDLIGGNLAVNYVLLKWRVGRKVGRTIYAQIAKRPSYNDPLIGVMDTTELAKSVVLAHNKEIKN